MSWFLLSLCYIPLLNKCNPQCQIFFGIAIKSHPHAIHFPHLQAIGLLQHLKSYKRISPPTDLESSHLLENCLDPSALANIRLPFHLLMQTTSYWKIICEYHTQFKLTMFMWSIRLHKYMIEWTLKNLHTLAPIRIWGILFLCLAPELSEETFPTLLLISKLMKVQYSAPLVAVVILYITVCF